jgi:cobaltochelatase CobT
VQTHEKALESCVRVLANSPKASVIFAQGGYAANTIVVETTTEHILERGFADAAAFFTRYHAPQTHAQFRPTTEAARLIFDRLEQTRTEMLGAQQFQGAGQNMALVQAHRLQTAQNATAENPYTAMAEGLCHSLLQGDTTPLIHALRETVQNQVIFAEKSIALLESVLPAATPQPAPKPAEEQAEDPDMLAQDATADEGSSDDAPPTSQSDKPQQGTPTAGQDLAEAGMAEDSRDNNDAAFDLKTETIAEAPPPYTIFTTQFDSICAANTLATPEELLTLRHQLDEKMREYQQLIAMLAHRLQRRLLSLQQRKWSFDLEEGMIDASRLPRLITDYAQTAIFKCEEESPFIHTVVTLLLDNSGSMRGRPIAITALAADILTQTLERCGVKVEILGFTTKSWKGGKIYGEWLKAGKPNNPGRLNELLHIIYKAADMPWQRARLHLGLMLKDGLLKENIDGEAVLWAYQRLKKRTEPRKILLVLSDGAPVDDATLSNNGGDYLENHLRKVIAHIERDPRIELSAIGIGHDVTRYYTNAITLENSETLGQVMTEQLEKLFIK